MSLVFLIFAITFFVLFLVCAVKEMAVLTGVFASFSVCLWVVALFQLGKPTPIPACKVVKSPVDIEVYEYRLEVDGVEVEKSKESKPLLDKCSVIQRKAIWMQKHKEEIIMEVVKIK